MLLRPVGVDMRPIRHDYDRGGDAGLSFLRSRSGSENLTLWFGSPG